MLGTALGALYGLSFGTYDGTVIIYLKFSIEGIAEGNFEGLVSLDGIELGTDDANVL